MIIVLAHVAAISDVAEDKCCEEDPKPYAFSVLTSGMDCAVILSFETKEKAKKVAKDLERCLLQYLKQGHPYTWTSPWPMGGLI